MADVIALYSTSSPTSRRRTATPTAMASLRYRPILTTGLCTSCICGLSRTQ